MGFYGICMPVIPLGLALLLAGSFGEIVMIHDTLDHTTKLTCVSEDDGAALVVNYNLTSVSSAYSDFREFKPTEPWRSTECPLLLECLTQWITTFHWNVVNSKQHPMGPVFDARWEDFDEWILARDKPQYVNNIKDSGIIVFSARSLGSIQLRLCTEDNSCSMASTLTAPNKRTKTRSNFSEMSCIGERTFSKPDQSFVSEHEWRTFVIQWNKTLGEIKTYEVNQSEALIKRSLKNTIMDISSNNLHRLLIQSSGLGLVRFHFYYYFLTEKEGSTISYQFEHAERNFCIELLVALCSTCDLSVYIADSNGNREFIKNIPGVNETPYGKLLTWQISKINWTLSKNFRNSLKLVIVAGVTGTRVNGRWAIGCFRKCKRVGAVRKSTVITVHESTEGLTDNSNCNEPIIRCQKLFYNENAVVSSHATHVDKITSSLEECIRGKGDPSCEFQYPDKTTARLICNPFGCICAPGFQLGGCTAACGPGYHGYDCRAYCLSSCVNGKCDKSTGSCSEGCKDGLLPPYCDTYLKPPIVEDVADTTALVYYPAELDWGKESYLTYMITTEEGSWEPRYASLGDTSNLRMFEKTITDLTPETFYFIRAEIMAKGISSRYANFTTTCTVPSIPLDLRVMAQEKGVVLVRWDYPQDSLTQIMQFDIRVIFIKTRLRKNPHRYDEIVQTLSTEKYEKNYHLMLYLPTSTEWNFYVKAVNACGSSPAATIPFWVPSSVGFQTGEKIDVTRNKTFMTIKIPALVNTTLHTIVKIIIKGSPTCAIIPVPEDLRKLVNIKNSGEEWIAETFSAHESGSKYLTVGNEPTNHNSEKCYLRSNETYVVVVVVTDELEQTSNIINSFTVDPPKSARFRGDIPWSKLMWLLIFPLLLICLLLLYCYYRQRKNYCAQTESLPPDQYYDDVLSLQPIDKPADDWLHDCCPHPTKLTTFENNVQMAVENGQFKSEFAMLPRGLVRAYDHGSLPENKSKNRSEDSIAYDDTRVKLRNNSTGPQSDYINANYIQGYCKEKAYIATQSPMSETMVDFWRMIWQEDVQVICMLEDVIEDGKTMCEQYWPEIRKTVKYGNIVISNLKQQVYAHYTYRTFQLTSSRTPSRQVKHLQYTGWPKRGVPMYSHSIVEYLNKIRATPSGPGPIVVHCSTGTGRTGTIILCDICIRYTATEGTVNLFAEAMKMYSARGNMLDNLQQYILAHLVPTQCLLLLPTKLPCSDISLVNIEEMKKDLPAHMQRLGVSSWKDKALQYPLKRPSLLNPEHLAKNRFPKFTPVGHNVVKLKRYPKHDSSSEYISAISVDGIRTENQYLASQLPLPSTLSDFWRLVAEKKVELVVILQRPDPNDVSCIDIIPRKTPLNPVPYLTVKTKAAYSNEHFTTDQVLLTDKSEKKPRTQNVTILTCNNWGVAEDAEPPPPETMVSLWSASEKVSRSEGPTLVLCHDGVTGCGLYMALSVLLERMAVEQECDVILAVRIIRQARIEFVYTKAQFEYLYDAAMSFAEEFQTYSNFI